MKLNTLTLTLAAIAMLGINALTPSFASDRPMTIEASKNLYHGYTAKNANGTINVVVEIPAGTNAKYEVNTKTGNLDWEIKKGKPRMVKYLAYPANYSMIPSTLSDPDNGGDGDPLDVLLLGESKPQASVVEAKLIGVMNMLDDGEVDDKLIAVAKDSCFADINTVTELEKKFNGSTKVLKTWFENYKGKKANVKIAGFKDATEANQILDNAIAGFKKHAK